MIFESKDGEYVHKRIKKDTIRPFEALSDELGYKGRGGWLKLFRKAYEFISENKSLFRK